MQAVVGAGLVPASGSCLPPLRLLQPRSVEVVVQLLRDAERPLLLAGGTDLVAAFNEGTTAAELIDLAKVEALRRITAQDGQLEIGAMATHDEGSRHAAVREHALGFAAAWARIANPRIRFTATLGGNLMARRVRYEASVLLSALEARLQFVSAGGPAELSPAEVWSGGVPARSLLRTVSIPVSDLQWFGYERSMRPLMTLATAWRRDGGGGRLVCAVATEFLQPVVLRALVGSTVALSNAANARAVARDLFEQLPDSFHDPVLNAAYARAAGAALLGRQLEGAARD